jgi:hypothetical protein
VIAEQYRKAYPLGSAYINVYDARPMLHIRSERNKRYTSLSYVNAVTRDSNLIPPAEELRHAYHVAGDSFIGKLKETFLVLDDDIAKKPSRSGGKNKAVSGSGSKAGNKAGSKANKRRASGEVASDPSKKVSATQ